MPTYEYRCDACKHQFEEIQKISEPALTKCPVCGEERVKRLIAATAFHLKGGGWYKTDYASGGSPGAKESSAAGGTANSSESSAAAGSTDSSSSTGSGSADKASGGDSKTSSSGGAETKPSPGSSDSSSGSGGKD